ncbi:MAG TPA: hypothetical protein VFO29_09590 [Candidatus Rubrimentiphilum sp.]|nr:hypothetical protein [Candidatus Rubrimentiphilum sp.]
MNKRSARSAALAFLASTAIGIAGCGNPSAGPSPAPSASNDIVRTGDGVRLGSGWWPVEFHNGLTFRWVTNDAEVTACPDANNRTLAMMIEPGPGVRSKPFTLHVLGNHGDSETSVVKAGQYVKVTVNQNAPAETFVLHADSPNIPTPRDPRHVLNFRARSIILGSSAGDCKNEIVYDASPLAVGKNWYPYETFNGQSFRWVDNDAQVTLTAAQPRPFVLEAEVEPGPSLGGAPLAIAVRNASGKTIVQSAPVKGRNYVSLRIPAQPKGTVLALAVNSKNVKVANDKRTLNFRVFGLKIKP